MICEIGQWKDVLEAVKRLCIENPNKILIIAIDGKSGGGKTTLAELLRDTYGGNVFHMDDFFLRPEQRTELRLSEIGGNVDYERFHDVLTLIKEGKNIDYQPYDCHRQMLTSKRSMDSRRFNIVEGSYSMHPYFGNIYDYRVTLDIDEDKQRKRIYRRNGAAMLKQFENEWIPKENAYLNKFKIFEKCNLKINI